MTNTYSYQQQPYPGHSAQHYYELGVQARKEGDAGKAEGLYRKALELDCGNGQYHASLASSLTKRGALHEALPHWRVAHKLEPNKPAFAANLGTVLLETDQAEEALDCFQAASRMAPDNQSYKQSIAAACAKMSGFAPRTGFEPQPASAPIPSRPMAHETAEQQRRRNDTEALKNATNYVFVGGPQANQLTGDARRLKAANINRAIARENAVGNNMNNNNNASDSRRVQTAIAVDRPKPVMPLIMERRGVSAARYQQDMNDITELQKIFKKEEGKFDGVLLGVALATCGLGVLCLAAFGGEGYEKRHLKRMAAKVDEMNAYYGRFGVRWSHEYIVCAGEYLTYET